MIGAIAGDIIGSVFEHEPIMTKNFKLFGAGCRFTDDTVLTIAIADALLKGISFTKSMEKFYYFYPMVPYGARFHEWASSHDHKPYNSWGNGSAMRVSPVVYISTNVESVLNNARASAEVTHNHPEGIKGAQATALSIWLAKQGLDKETIKSEISSRFNYDLDKKLSVIRPDYQCDLSCQHTVP